MRVGIDFDNTIVSYDRLFHRLAVERALVDPSFPANKQAIRDALRNARCEEEWTRVQGIAYGARIVEAEPFPGVKRFLRQCRDAAVEVAIVSHKTVTPYLGEPYDLHLAAHEFLEQHGFYRADEAGLTPEHVHFEPTLGAKLARIAALGCSAFVDDLPELLAEPRFPAGVERIHFDPSGARRDDPRFTRVASWAQCSRLILARRMVRA
jgi:hypothetical protein